MTPPEIRPHQQAVIDFLQGLPPGFGSTRHLIHILGVYAGCNAAVLDVSGDCTMRVWVSADRINTAHAALYDNAPLGCRFDVQPFGPEHRYTTGFHVRHWAAPHRHQPRR